MGATHFLVVTFLFRSVVIYLTDFWLCRAALEPHYGGVESITTYDGVKVQNGGLYFS